MGMRGTYMRWLYRVLTLILMAISPLVMAGVAGEYVAMTICYALPRHDFTVVIGILLVLVLDLVAVIFAFRFRDELIKACKRYKERK